MSSSKRLDSQSKSVKEEVKLSFPVSRGGLGTYHPLLGVWVVISNGRGRDSRKRIGGPESLGERILRSKFASSSSIASPGNNHGNSSSQCRVVDFAPLPVVPLERMDVGSDIDGGGAP